MGKDNKAVFETDGAQKKEEWLNLIEGMWITSGMVDGLKSKDAPSTDIKNAGLKYLWDSMERTIKNMDQRILKITNHAKRNSGLAPLLEIGAIYNVRMDKVKQSMLSAQREVYSLASEVAKISMKLSGKEATESDSYGLISYMLSKNDYFLLKMFTPIAMVCDDLGVVIGVRFSSPVSLESPLLDSISNYVYEEYLNDTIVVRDEFREKILSEENVKRLREIIVKNRQEPKTIGDLVDGVFADTDTDTDEPEEQGSVEKTGGSIIKSKKSSYILKRAGTKDAERVGDGHHNEVKNSCVKHSCDLLVIDGSDSNMSACCDDQPISEKIAKINALLSSIIISTKDFPTDCLSFTNSDSGVKICFNGDIRELAITNSIATGILGNIISVINIIESTGYYSRCIFSSEEMEREVGLSDIIERAFAIISTDDSESVGEDIGEDVGNQLTAFHYLVGHLA